MVHAGASSYDAISRRVGAAVELCYQLWHVADQSLTMQQCPRFHWCSHHHPRFRLRNFGLSSRSVWWIQNQDFIVLISAGTGGYYTHDQATTKTLVLCTRPYDQRNASNSLHDLLPYNAIRSFDPF